ncbi:uncharacterized protein LOC123561644 [Mercenaria mercenaria]|uniref:uncharacterized protein LOC123561644 n=1 Tax=Mercenaria mercenaria TaxID=6596 RepID=UPI00234F5AA3|nr:uncharacterized protein LOC123561644 [Mercenaria mercenaria]
MALLYGRRITTPADYSAIQNVNSNHNTANKQVRIQRELLNRFWERWKTDYLTSLRERHTQSGQNKQTIKVGDVVQVHEDCPRLRWKLAVVEEQMPGKDGLTRSAMIRTGSGLTTRAIKKLYPLELNENERQLINFEAFRGPQNVGNNVHLYTQQVAFMAQLSKHLADPPIGTTVVFDTVHTNIGNGYKPGPGIFVAPVDGTYSINLVASSSTKATSAHLHLHMMHNTSKVGYIFLDHNSDRWLLRSATIVLELKAEDTIYVKIGHKTGTGMLAGCCFHTHFSGFLIH